MPNPPNRKRSGATTPSAADLRALLKAANVTQEAAAAMLYRHRNTIVQWLTDSGPSARRMPADSYALLRAKLAVLNGDDAAALAVLREGLGQSGALLAAGVAGALAPGGVLGALVDRR